MNKKIKKMYRKSIEDNIKEIKSLGQKFISFYVTYNNIGSIISNRWGTFDKLEKELDFIESCPAMNGKVMPIKKLVLFTETCVHCFSKNPLADVVNDDPEDLYVYTNVPLINKEGWFVDPKDFPVNKPGM